MPELGRAGLCTRGGGGGGGGVEKKQKRQSSSLKYDRKPYRFVFRCPSIQYGSSYVNNLHGLHDVDYAKR